MIGGLYFPLAANVRNEEPYLHWISTVGCLAEMGLPFPLVGKLGKSGHFSCFIPTFPGLSIQINQQPEPAPFFVLHAGDAVVGHRRSVGIGPGLG